MPIQFRCSACDQPIEVDDEFAGEDAACPYCRHVVTVPAESTLHADAPVIARPTSVSEPDADTPPADAASTPESPQEPAPSRPPTPRHPEPPAERHPPAPSRHDLPMRRSTPPPPPLGSLHVGPTLTPRQISARSYGGFALISCCLSIVLIFSGMLVSTAPPATTGSQPTMDELVKHSQKISDEHPWIVPAQLGGMFFAVVGLAFGIASLYQSTERNWRGFVAVIVCGLIVLCVFGLVTLFFILGVSAGGFPA